MTAARPNPSAPSGGRSLLPTAVLLVLVCALMALALPMPVQASTTGSGRAATEARPVAAFDRVAVAGAIDVVIRQAPSPAVTVTADDNLLPLIETVVEPGTGGATLRIAVRRGERIRTRAPIRVVVETPELKAVVGAGSGSLRIEDLETPALELALSGSGDAELVGLRAGSLGARMAGSGDVSARGSAAGALDLAIAGSGDASLDALPADDVKISIAGSGDARVTANRSLQVRIAGSGDVSWAGQATDVRSAVAGSGSVRRR